MFESRPFLTESTCMGDLIISQYKVKLALDKLTWLQNGFSYWDWEGTA